MSSLAALSGSPSAPAPMTLYDVLRKLIANESWSEQERRDAFTLIGELERLNVFGNLAGNLTTAHDQPDSEDDTP